MKKISRCKECLSYTLSRTCQQCGGQVTSPHPPRFSPQDRYGKYRRMLKAARRESA